MEAEDVASVVAEFEAVATVEVISEIIFADVLHFNNELLERFDLPSSADWLVVSPGNDAEPLHENANLRIVISL